MHLSVLGLPWGFHHLTSQDFAFEEACFGNTARRVAPAETPLPPKWRSLKTQLRAQHQCWVCSAKPQRDGESRAEVSAARWVWAQRRAVKTNCSAPWVQKLQLVLI